MLNPSRWTNAGLTLTALLITLVTFGSEAAIADQHTNAESPEPIESTEMPQGLIILESPYSVEETATRLQTLLGNNGITVFAEIDHAAGAAGVDLTLLPTQVIIFGNPLVGTPLMQCSQSVAIDLPQKALIWQDDVGQVYLGYNDPRYLAERHNLVDCEEAIARVEGALGRIGQAAVGPDVIEAAPPE
ncbi:MAG: DUF302 domain-containing protein [Cyanobacteria bacterium J06635_15]